MTAIPKYILEFPDFDHAPELPEGFEDVSWHNDASPSFQFIDTGNTLYVNYRDPDFREYEAAFFVLDDGREGDTRTLYIGDDYAEALRVAMAPVLVQGEGYDEETGKNFPALGFLHAGTFITDPHQSECGRFEADPLIYYRLTPEQVAAMDADAAQRAKPAA